MSLNGFNNCDYCDNYDKDKSHGADFLTDYNQINKITWWQSDTMEYGVQYPNYVNLTLHLGKYLF
jgi:hypothetical protein